MARQQQLFPKRKRRRGAGRPAKGPRSSEKHKVRAPVRSGHPVHVVIRGAPIVKTLRTRAIYHAVRKALVTTFPRQDFHVVHVSIQGNHIHLLIEAQDKIALARGMQGFQIAAAKHINAAISKRQETRRRGTVFPDRYHARTIDNRCQARHALAYVLNNWRHHGESQTVVGAHWRIDPFSSAASFDGWRDLADPRAAFPDSYEPLPVWKPKSWYLKAGWRQYGLVRTTEVPGGATKRRARQPAFAE